MGKITDALDTQDQFTADRKKVEQQVGQALGYFGHVLPSHADKDQYVALVLGLLRRNAKLAQAAVEDTPSFMVALVDCARLGLVPGVTYHLVPFFDSKARVHRTTGMVDYKGEIEMIYNSGDIAGVHAHVIRGGPDAAKPDVFRWQPGMTLPVHEIADDGLAMIEERGPLRGAWAYATYHDGGMSPVIVMDRSEIAKHRNAAKTQDFWGPPWPAEGPWTPDMWVKTVLHRLYDRVPHSAEHQQRVMRATAEAERIPAAMLAPAAAQPAAISPPDDLTEPGPPAIQGHVEPAAQTGRRSRAHAEPASEPATPAPAGERAERQHVMRALSTLLDTAGLTTEHDEAERLTLLGVLATDEQPLRLTATAELSTAQAQHAEHNLRALLDDCARAERNPREALIAIAAEAGRQAARA